MPSLWDNLAKFAYLYFLRGKGNIALVNEIVSSIHLSLDGTIVVSFYVIFRTQLYWK